MPLVRRVGCEGLQDRGQVGRASKQLVANRIDEIFVNPLVSRFDTSFDESIRTDFLKLLWV